MPLGRFRQTRRAEIKWYTTPAGLRWWCECTGQNYTYYKDVHKTFSSH